MSKAYNMNRLFSSVRGRRMLSSGKDVRSTEYPKIKQEGNISTIVQTETKHNPFNL